MAGEEEPGRTHGIISHKRKAAASGNFWEKNAMRKLKKGPFNMLKLSDSKSAKPLAREYDCKESLSDSKPPASDEGCAERSGDEDALEDDGDIGIDVETLPSDTMVAIKLMLKQFPVVEKSVARPFVLRSQLYSSVADRTVVDRQLEALKQRRQVRVFKLITAKDDHAIMLTEDYLEQVTSSKRRMENKAEPHWLLAFDWFKAHVLPVCLSAGITHSELVGLLAAGGVVEDKHISVLIQGGLLVRQLADGMAYWFAMPDIGLLLKSLVQGRRELAGLLSRQKFKEMLQAQLTKRQLRYSKLGMQFHIRDLQGLGLLEAVSTPAGPLLRLTSTSL